MTVGIVAGMCAAALRGGARWWYPRTLTWRSYEPLVSVVAFCP